MTPQKLKQTEIGEIPEDWELKPVGDILTLEYGKGLSESNRKMGPYPVYGSNGVVGNHFEFLVQAPGIIVGRKGSIGEVVWADKNFWPIDTTYYVKPKSNKTSLRWLYYKLQKMGLSKLNTATGIPGLNRELVYVQKIPVPGEREQDEIATVLLTIDKRLDIIERERQAVERLKVGIMRKLFEDKDWKIVKLGYENLFELIMGQSPPSSSYNREGKGLPFLQGNAEFGPIYPSPTIYCSKPLKVAKSGDVLISVRAPVGELNIADKDCCIGRGIGAIRAKSGINHIFLFYYLKFINRKINSMAGGSTFKAVTKSQLERFEITIPSLQEQEKIAEILSNLDKKLSIQQFKKSKLEMIKKGLMNNLLSGNKRIRVEKFLGEEK